MTTAMRETPNLWVHVQEPSEWCGRSKHILLTQRGWKARKIPAMGKVFLLTVPFIERTFQCEQPAVVGTTISLKARTKTYRYPHFLQRLCHLLLQLGLPFRDP